jgi:error-prone DNA polymerase
MTDYVELQVTTNFSFLRGGSHPHELVLTAKLLGHRAIGVADRNSLAGVVRAHSAGEEVGQRVLIGARLDFTDHESLLCYPTDRAAYGRLCRLLTAGRLRAPKGECALRFADLAAWSAGQLLIALAPDTIDDGFARALVELAARFPGQCYVAASHRYAGDDAARIDRLAALAAAARLPLVATNDVHYHEPGRRALQDVVTCIREGCTVAEAGFRLAANAERHLRSADEMARLFRQHPDALARTVEIAERCRFSLGELRYEYPEETTEAGRTPQQQLEHLAWQGVAERFPPELFPGGVPDKVRETLAHELALIDRLNYAPYFLTVHDAVRFARSQHILCQGRGSAANSVVCYCLGITSVDPTKVDLLFERFVSAERNEPPDIDVDFEHERREEVIQYIYKKYGRDRAGIAASVSCYRARGAMREVGKALGLSLDTVAKLANSVWGWGVEAIDDDRVRELGLDPEARPMRLAIDLARELIGFPRHLSQHVGGFVITRGPLSEVVPITNAAMADRTVIEWDKDDLDALRILKIDVLALGMLTCIRKAFGLIEQHTGKAYALATVPAEDPAVYDMLCEADSLGVFQVESRAQMSMLPRLRPREFYDLVIEVAIVRPGPIQGDMVHPYLRRRDGKEEVVYPSEELRAVLEKTKGVPLFQEQAMRIAIVAAGFTPAEADKLRRAMATFRKLGEVSSFGEQLIEGMVARGYDRAFATRCFRQIEGFGTYGFPESHAASFALLVYVSSWIKCHHPAAFAAALLNSQPMGFYAPAQIVRDAREHGVIVRPPDVNLSAWDCTLEPDPASTGGLAVQLGLREVKGVGEDQMARLVAARETGYDSPFAIWRRARLGPGVLAALAAADAFRSVGLDRRAAEWAVKALGDAAPLPLFAAVGEAVERLPEPAVALPALGLGEHVMLDYATLGLSLKAHPMKLLRPLFDRERIVPSCRLIEIAPGRRVSVAGLVLVRQQPGSAKGVIFITLEDEAGIANLIVWPPMFERFRRVVLTGALITATGRLQRERSVIHLVVDRLVDHSARLKTLTQPGDDPVRAAQRAIAPADAIRRNGGPDPRDLAMIEQYQQQRDDPAEQIRRLSRDFR